MQTVRKGPDFAKIDTADPPDLRQEMNESSCQNTLPRLVIDSNLIGRCNKLALLNQSTEFADLLRIETTECTRGAMDL